ncbi:AI-2E family transporter [Lacipirellula limnantheis]|uniref:Putative inner membrane protein n=1 Tax=Lacipirellula limnantheis TaxID=2528024 RepID=A0A517TWV8_9BACT|nr:AI-2E family transporter [Lacipirellula limnantheis]QDT72851.1 putative inner membrane protein [Lacipirellula limnantheis]
MPRVVSFIVLVAILAFIAAMFFKVMAQFVLPLFLAAVLVVVFKPLHVWVRDRLPGRLRLSALVTTFLIMLVVLLPTAWLGWNAYLEGVQLFNYLKVPANQKHLITKIETAAQPFVEFYEQLVPASQTTETETSAAADAEPEVPQAAAATEDSSAGETPLEEGDDEETTEELATTGSATSDAVNRTSAAKRSFTAKDLVDIAIGFIGANLFDTLEGVLRTLLGLIIMVLAIYYFLVDGPTMIHTMMRLSPLDNEYERELLDKFANVSRAVVVAVLAAAVVQGLLAGIGFYFAMSPGAPIFLLMMVTMIASVIPFIGAAGIWIPTSIWIFLYQGERIVTDSNGVESVVTGDPWAAILLALYCGGVVSTIDNVIKPLVLHGQSNLHPLLALMSVLGGVKALGPVGILVGPMLVAFIHALLVMVNKELRLLSSGDVVGDRQKVMFPLGPGDPTSPLSDDAAAIAAATAKPLGPLARVRNAAKRRRRKK